MSWLNPGAAPWLLLIPALVALYMLRPTPTKRAVSSLRLWEKLPQIDRPRARLRRPPLSLLLLLQLLLLGAGAIALLQPAFSAPEGRHTVILLDASGSMTASDGTTVRFDQAKEEARKLIAEMRPTDRATLLRVGSSVSALCAGCERATLERALEAARAGAGSAQWREALAVASGLAGRGEAGTVSAVVISDGAFDALPADLLPPSSRFIAVGRPVANRAIVALSARRPLDGKAGYSAYARIENAGSSETRVEVEALADTVPLPTRNLTLPGGGYADLIWTVPAGTTRFTVRLGGDDSLAADNRAILTLPLEGQHKVAIRSPRPDVYSRALLGIPGLQPLVLTDTANSGVAFTIIEGQVPDPLPAGSLLLVSPEGDFLPALGEMESIQLLAAGSGHPLLNGIDLRALIVNRAAQFELPSWLEPVVETENGPLIMAGERGGRRVAVLAFLPSDSNLPKLAAFPLLMANLVDWLQPLYAAQSLQPGEPAYLLPGSQVQTPGGASVSVGNTGLFGETEEAGLYSVRGPKGVEATFAVNMADRAESGAAPQAHPELERSVVAPTERMLNQEVWWPLLLAALGLLVGEWILYSVKRGRI